MNDAGLERGLEQLGDGGGPPEAWQETVLARIDHPPAPRRARWPFVVAGSGLLAAAAAVALFVALRVPSRPTPSVDERNRFEQLVREIDRLSALKEHASEQLLHAVTEAEKADAQQALDKAREERREVGKALQSLERKHKARKRDAGKIAVKCDPNDPLCAVE